MGPIVALLTGEAQAGVVLAREFQRQGATVFQGNTRASAEFARTVRERVRHIDLLVVYPATLPPDPDYPELDFALLRQTYETNALDVLRSVEAFLPLMPQGWKRLCFVLDGDPVHDELAYTNDLGDAMAKAALTMAYKNLFNDLRRGRYTFRLFHVGSEAGNEFVEVAVEYFLADRADEDTLTIRDLQGKEVSL